MNDNNDTQYNDYHNQTDNTLINVDESHGLKFADGSRKSQMNMKTRAEKSVSDYDNISNNQLDMQSIYTDYQDTGKQQILRQLKDLEDGVEWQLYDAHESATIYSDRVTTNGFLSTRRFNFNKEKTD